jgi:hypothetical protein
MITQSKGSALMCRLSIFESNWCLGDGFSLLFAEVVKMDMTVMSSGKVAPLNTRCLLVRSMSRGEE